MRRPAAIAYLFARAADTLADSWSGNCAERRALLATFRAAIDRASHGDASIPRLPSPPACVAPPERRLMHDMGLAFPVLASMRPPVRAMIRRVLMTLTDGMYTDMKAFDGASHAIPAARPDAAALDRYTYLIAGCVGEFWTDLAIACGTWPAEHRAPLVRDGILFGKGLQLVNILRDVPSDLTRGRVYLPAPDLAAQGIAPADLNDPAVFTRVRPVFAKYTDLAAAHFAAAQRYVVAVPRRCLRLRLACVWPLWFGLATLRDLAACPNPLAGPPVRIRQGDVYRMLALSAVIAPSNTALARVYRKLTR